MASLPKGVTRSAFAVVFGISTAVVGIQLEKATHENSRLDGELIAKHNELTTTTELLETAKEDFADFKRQTSVNTITALQAAKTEKEVALAEQLESLNATHDAAQAALLDKFELRQTNLQEAHRETLEKLNIENKAATVALVAKYNALVDEAQLTLVDANDQFEVEKAELQRKLEHETIVANENLNRVMARANLSKATALSEEQLRAQAAYEELSDTLESRIVALRDELQSQKDDYNATLAERKLAAEEALATQKTELEEAAQAQREDLIERFDAEQTRTEAQHQQILLTLKESNVRALELQAEATKTTIAQLEARLAENAQAAERILTQLQDESAKEIAKYKGALQTDVVVAEYIERRYPELSDKWRASYTSSIMTIAKQNDLPPMLLASTIAVRSGFLAENDDFDTFIGPINVDPEKRRALMAANDLTYNDLINVNLAVLTSVDVITQELESLVDDQGRVDVSAALEASLKNGNSDAVLAILNEYVNEDIHRISVRSAQEAQAE